MVENKINWAVELEENGHEFTENGKEAIYIFPDGRMISGMFEEGYRGEDHRMIECYTGNLNRYDEKVFWNYVHYDLSLVMLVPETMYALIKEGQQLTKEQSKLIKQWGYKTEEY